MSGTVGVERIFPVNMPALQKIEVNKRGKVRRARIFYFRGLTGKKQESKKQDAKSFVFTKVLKSTQTIECFFYSTPSRKVIHN